MMLDSTGNKYGGYVNGKPYVPSGSKMIRRDTRNINSGDFKDFIRSQGKSFEQSERKNIGKHGLLQMGEDMSAIIGRI